MAWQPLPNQHGLLALFGAAAILLIALGSWWFVFIQAAVRAEYHYEQLALGHEAQVRALQLGRLPAPQSALLVGRVPLEIVTASAVAADERNAYWQCTGAEIVKNAPNYVDLACPAVRPTAAAYAGVQRHYQRRRAMVYGEGGLLVSLLTIVLAMLARLVRAEQRFRHEMNDFLGRVTHEMKTPLAGIKAVLQTLHAGRMPPEQMQEMAAMALQQADRQEHLIQNMLLAQRMRVPQHQLAKENIDVFAVLTRFVEHRALLLPAGTLQLHCTPDLRALADPTALWTILENLSDNALKYGAKRLEITVTQSDGLRIELRDDGIGFEPQRAERLFDAFVRGHGPPVHGHGTGLGLSLSRGLARKMGGDLTAESEGPSKGAVFTVTLPLA